MNLDLPPLLKWIPQHSPEFDEPIHFGDIGELFGEALANVRGQAAEPLRVLCTYPIRHYKTETFLHGVLWLLMHEPTLRIVVLTYSHGRAKDMGKRLRELARRTEVGPARGFDTIEDWKNDAGGGVVVMSAEQSKEGYDCHVLLCDDPLDEVGAASAEKREQVDRAISYYTARCMRKGRPGPVLLIMSRQHPDDPIGRRVARTAVRWRHLHQPAIIGLGTSQERAFAPNVWPLEELRRIREEAKESDPYERVFWSRFQGEPVAVGASFYREPARYTTLPEWLGFREAIGLDMSYSPKRTADWFAATLVRFVDRKAYVVATLRVKPDPREVPGLIRAMQAMSRGGNAPVYTYAGGPEFGVVARLNADHGLNVQAMNAGLNKLWRSQRTIKRWNDGEILVPADAVWAASYIKRIQGFSGLDGDEDDENDALVSVCDAVLGSGMAKPIAAGKWRI